MLSRCGARAQAGPTNYAVCQFRRQDDASDSVTNAIIEMKGGHLTSKQCKQGMLALFVLSTAGFSQETYNAQPVVPGRVIVKFRNSAQTAIARHRSSLQINSMSPIGGTGAVLLNSTANRVTEMVAVLGRDPDVLYVEPDYIVRIGQEPRAIPSDPHFNLLWGLSNNGQAIRGTAGVPGIDVGAVPAWDRTQGSTQTVVGVLDTGVDYRHPDLAPNIWRSPALSLTVGNRQVNCAAGSPGFNAVTMTCDPLDDNGHGTHCAGTIGAVGNNQAGIAGVNWATSIIALKFLRSNGSGYTSDAVNAMEFLVQLKQRYGVNVRVLSNSWGGGAYSQALLEQIQRLNSSDILFVAAAGNDTRNNDTTPTYPASYPVENIVSVAAINNRGNLAQFSNYGVRTVHLGAPGEDVLSTLPGNQFGFSSGTSMATPHVAGVAALTLARCQLSALQLRQVLLQTAVPTPALSNTTATGGRVNVNTALQSCDPQRQTITVSPALVAVGPGQPANYRVNFTGTGPARLNVTGLPAGAAATFIPPTLTASGTAALTVQTSSGTPTGRFPLTISASTPGGVVSARAELSVDGFTLRIADPSMAVNAGTAAQYSITIAPAGSFSDFVDLSVDGVPSGATAAFSPASPRAPGSSILRVSTAAQLAGVFSMRVRGRARSSGLVREVPITLTVRNFSLSATPTKITVRRGAQATYRIEVRAQGGFNSRVSLSVSGRTNSTANISPSSVNGSGTASVQIRTSAASPTGTHTLTVTGTSGSLEQRIPLTLVITP